MEFREEGLWKASDFHHKGCLNHTSLDDPRLNHSTSFVRVDGLVKNGVPLPVKCYLVDSLLANFKAASPQVRMIVSAVKTCCCEYCGLDDALRCSTNLCLLYWGLFDISGPCKGFGMIGKQVSSFEASRESVVAPTHTLIPRSSRNAAMHKADAIRSLERLIPAVRIEVTLSGIADCISLPLRVSRHYIVCWDSSQI